MMDGSGEVQSGEGPLGPSVRPVHPALEAFHTAIAADASTSGGQLGVRVARGWGSPLPASTFLGLFDGWVGTSVEAHAALSKAAPLSDCLSDCLSPSLPHCLGACLEEHPPSKPHNTEAAHNTEALRTSLLPRSPGALLASCLERCHARARALLRWHAYMAELVLISGHRTSGRPRAQQLVVAPLSPVDGAFLGNLTARINDGRLDGFCSPLTPPAPPPAPPAPPPAVCAARAASHHDESCEPLCQSAEALGGPPRALPDGAEAAEGAGGPDRSGSKECARPSNAELVQVVHEGWFHLAVCSTRPLAAGEEVLLAYGEGHWREHARLLRRVSTLQLWHECWHEHRYERGVAERQGRGVTGAIMGVTGALCWLGTMMAVWGGALLVLAETLYDEWQARRGVRQLMREELQRSQSHASSPCALHVVTET